MTKKMKGIFEMKAYQVAQELSKPRAGFEGPTETFTMKRFEAVGGTTGIAYFVKSTGKYALAWMAWMNKGKKGPDGISTTGDVLVHLEDVECVMCRYDHALHQLGRRVEEQLARIEMFNSTLESETLPWEEDDG
jgi:hypothetical protein